MDTLRLLTLRRGLTFDDLGGPGSVLVRSRLDVATVDRLITEAQRIAAPLAYARTVGAASRSGPRSRP